MKKRCQYCRGIVKIKEEEIKNIEGNGRGILCDLCGAFIEIPKQINGNVRLSLSDKHFTGGSWRRNKMRREKLMILGVLIITLFILPMFIFFYNSFGFPPHLPEDKYSTFQFLDEYTDYDISNKLNISILTPKNGVEFNENKDIYMMSNFEETVHMRVSLIQIDIRNFGYIWIFTDPLNISTYRSNYYLVIGGINYDYVFNIKLEEIYYHLYNFSDNTVL